LVKGIGEHGSIERAAASISISIAVLAPKEIMWGERWFRAIRIEQGWILIMFRLVGIGVVWQGGRGSRVQAVILLFYG
jgi:hypothetical protein